jgi:hypothetical protein
MHALANLPDDLFVEIVVRLPAQSIARCHAVCRAWRFAISHTSFDMAYARRPAAVATVTADERGIVLETDYTYAIIQGTPTTPRLLGSGTSVFFDFFRRRWRHRRNTDTTVRGSWDGVLCIERGVWKGPQMRYQVEQYLLWNPVTLAYATVPPPVDCSGQIIGAYAHPTTRAYHLVHVSGEDDGTYDVMSLTTFRVLRVGAALAWREIEIPTLALLKEESSTDDGAQISRNARSVGLHGNLHWLVLSGSGTLRLLAFDTARDTFRSLEAPEHRRRPADLTTARLGALSGSSKLCIFFVEPSMSSVDLWLLDDYRATATVTRSSWRLKERISLVTLTCECEPPWTFDASTEVEVVEGEEEIFLHHSTHITVYNVGCKAWRSTVDVAPWAGKTSHVSLVMHRESLVQNEVSFGQASRAVSRKLHYDGTSRYCV